MYTVYILFSEKFHKIYIGYTNNLESRLLSHNELGKKGWTLNFRPWRLVYSEQFKTKKEAILKERQLKSGQGRAWIWTTIIAKL
jgi:putative endonuclease